MSVSKNDGRVPARHKAITTSPKRDRQNLILAALDHIRLLFYISKVVLMWPFIMSVRCTLCLGRIGGHRLVPIDLPSDLFCCLQTRQLIGCIVSLFARQLTTRRTQCLYFYVNVHSNISLLVVTSKRSLNIIRRCCCGCLFHQNALLECCYSVIFSLFNSILYMKKWFTLKTQFTET